MTDSVYRPATKELAERIFVDLVGRNVRVSDQGANLAVSADDLAKLSFALAHAFRAVEDQLNASNLPKNADYKLGAQDVADWMK